MADHAGHADLTLGPIGPGSYMICTSQDQRAISQLRSYYTFYAAKIRYKMNGYGQLAMNDLQTLLENK